MKLSIGQNLKKLRLKKGLTQEQLGEVFGVSPQAVSRWENDTAYPDITMLPGIAIFYDTTVDALIGMNELRRTEKLNQIHGEVQRLAAIGENTRAEELLRESLQLYPDNTSLLMALGETLAHKSDDVSTEEAIRIGEKILHSEEISMKAKGTAAANLLFLYLRTGRKNEAKTLLYSLPHLWESREVLMPELSENADYEAALREMILKVLVFLSGKIEASADHRCGDTPLYIQNGVDFTPKMSVEQMLQQIKEFMESR